MNWYIQVLKKYAVFSGRSRRAEYWTFTFINAIVGFALALVEVILTGDVSESGVTVLGGLYWLVVLLPSLGVTVRRLHDTGRSGWLFLLVLVPLIGPIFLLVYFVEDSQLGENKYGPNPKGVDSTSAQEGLRPRPCPHCGTQYLPADYDPNATAWNCASCKNSLPRD